MLNPRRPFVVRTIQMATVRGQEEVVLRVCCPVRAKGAYRCDYEISMGREVLRASKAYGEDSLQALLLALSLLAIEMELALRKAGGSVDPNLLTDLLRLRPT